MNSFRSLERAVAYEIVRQVDELEAGGTIVQETRHWDEEAGVTHGMRTKEGSSDYRYFTEPDLTPIVIDAGVAGPRSRRCPSCPPPGVRLRGSRGGPAGREVLADAEQPLRTLYDEAAASGAEPRVAANWVTGEITGWMRREDNRSAHHRSQLAELVAMVAEGVVSASAAKDVLDGVMRGEGGSGEVAEARDLTADDGHRGDRVGGRRGARAQPDAVERYRGNGETEGRGIPRRTGHAGHPGQGRSESRQRPAHPETRMILYGLEAAAVLFDCDGVLVDSEPVSFLAWSRTLAAHGHTLDEAQFAESVGGTEAMVAIGSRRRSGVDAEALEAEAREAFERMPRAAGFPDTLELVAAAGGRGVPIAVATNGLRWRLDALLAAVGLERMLPVSVTADEVRRPKPAPDLYLAAAALVGHDPGRASSSRTARPGSLRPRRRGVA
jgi:beta-phosphoglucomutase-like phosphatase (HAD superfamily)